MVECIDGEVLCSECGAETKKEAGGGGNAVPPTAASATTRVCRICGVEKSIDGFYMTDHRWYLHVCKWCFCARSRERLARIRVRNLELYGYTRTPAKQEEEAKLRARNRRLYGHTKTPECAERCRLQLIERRRQAINLYGGECECCGDSDPGLLTFDHINGDGRRLSGARLVRAVLGEFEVLGYPNGKYRLLCWNCNCAMGLFGYCPHHSISTEEKPANRTREPAKYNRQFGHRRKLEFIAEYGGKCQICGEDHWEFLTLDHTNGGGIQHREGLGIGGGVSFYTWLRRQGWPKDGYRLLCFNCNGGRLKKAGTTTW